LHGVDSDILPVWERWFEGHCIGLENSNGKRGDCIVGLHATSIAVGDCDSGVIVGDVGDNCVEKQAGIIISQEFGGLAVEEGVVSSLVDGKLVEFREAVEC